MNWQDFLKQEKRIKADILDGELNEMPLKEPEIPSSPPDFVAESMKFWVDEGVLVDNSDRAFRLRIHEENIEFWCKYENKWSKFEDHNRYSISNIMQGYNGWLAEKILLENEDG